MKADVAFVVVVLFVPITRLASPLAVPLGPKLLPCANTLTARAEIASVDTITFLFIVQIPRII